MKKSKTRNVKRKGGSQQRVVRHVKVKTPSQTITVELTKEQTEAIEDAYFDTALLECTAMTGLTKGKQLYIGIAHPDHDYKPELKINLDKTIRELASGNWMASDYDELAAMVKSFGRTYDFLKRYLKTWETDEDEVPNDPSSGAAK